MTDLEKRIWNEGERLIPGVSHNGAESKRHFASYNFFRDRIYETEVGTINILDLGCGVGFGCKLLSVVPDSNILGIDISDDSLRYARKYYSAKNIEYRIADLNSFILNMPLYDYVVSRGVFEHIENVWDLINKIKFKKMLIFDMPYNEEPGNNPHHKILGVVEKDFEKLVSSYELFYEDIEGKITKQKPEKPNMIMCLCRK